MAVFVSGFFKHQAGKLSVMRETHVFFVKTVNCKISQTSEYTEYAEGSKGNTFSLKCLRTSTKVKRRV